MKTPPREPNFPFPQPAVNVWFASLDVSKNKSFTRLLDFFRFAYDVHPVSKALQTKST